MSRCVHVSAVPARSGSRCRQHSSGSEAWPVCVLPSVQGTDDYYTMSSKGVTHFWDGQADFSGLEQFERDYFLYTQLMKLNMFRQFRLWKTFKVGRGRLAAMQCRLWRWPRMMQQLDNTHTT